MSALDEQVGGSWYKKLAIQPGVYCQKNKILAFETFAIKYITRHRDAYGLKDIRKAIHCLELLIEIEYGDELTGYEVKFHILDDNKKIQVHYRYFRNETEARKFYDARGGSKWINSFNYIISEGEAYHWQDVP